MGQDWEKPQPNRLAPVASPETAARVRLTCTFCHAQMREGVYCAGCLAPHHADYDTLNLDIARRNDDGFITLVGRRKTHLATAPTESLKCGLLVGKKSHHNITNGWGYS